MSNDIYSIISKLDSIEESAKPGLNQGAGPEFPGYWGASQSADMSRKRMVGDGKLRDAMRKIEEEDQEELEQREAELTEKWSEKYKRSIDCSNPKGFSQRAHCDGRKKNESTDTDVNDIDADTAAAEQAADEMQVNEAVTTEDVISDKIVDKLQDMLHDLKADTKPKKDSDLHSKDAAEATKKKLAPVMRAKFGQDGMQIAEICGNLDDGFVIVVDGREISGNLPNITAARKALQELHTELANKPALEGADYVDEA